MAEKFAKYWLTKSDSKAKIISCIAGSITVAVKKLPLKNTLLGLMMHYWCGRGEPMTLSGRFWGSKPKPTKSSNNHE